MEKSINIREYIDMFKRRKLIIILVMIASLALGAYKTYQNYISYVPTYTSSITVRINTSKNIKKDNKDDEDGYVDSYSTYNVAQNQNIATSYKSLASSPNVTNIIAGTLKISSSDVGSISVMQREEMAEFIDISVVNQNKELSKKVAEIVPEAFNEELIRLVGYDCVEVVYEASEPALIERSNYNVIAKYAMMGMVLSIFLVLLRECLDTKIVTPDDVNKYWGYQLIGTIPLDSNSLKGKHSSKA